MAWSLRTQLIRDARFCVSTLIFPRQRLLFVLFCDCVPPLHRTCRQLPGKHLPRSLSSSQPRARPTAGRDVRVRGPRAGAQGFTLLWCESSCLLTEAQDGLLILHVMKGTCRACGFREGVVACSCFFVPAVLMVGNRRHLQHLQSQHCQFLHFLSYLHACVGLPVVRVSFRGSQEHNAWSDTCALDGFSAPHAHECAFVEVEANSTWRGPVLSLPAGCRSLMLLISAQGSLVTSAHDHLDEQVDP